MRSFTTGALALMAVAACGPAAAEDTQTYYLAARVTPDRMVFNMRGLLLRSEEEAREQFDDAAAEERAFLVDHVRAIGGRVITAIPRVTDRELREQAGLLFVRFTGEVQLLYTAPREPDGPLAGARPVDPRLSRGLVMLEAVDARHERAVGDEGVRLTAQELFALSKPERVRETTVGALLRRRWEAALGGVSDDPERYEARVRPVLFVHGPDGAKLGQISFDPLDRGDADILLRRRLTLWEGIWKGATARAKSFPTVDEATDAQLGRALHWAREGDHLRDDEHWARLRAARLRRGGLTEDDRAWLARAEVPSGTRRAAETLPAGAHRGAAGALGALGK